MVSLPELQSAAACEVALKVRSNAPTGLVAEPPFSVPTPVDLSKVRADASVSKYHTCCSVPVPPAVTGRTIPAVIVSGMLVSLTDRNHDCPLEVFTDAPSLFSVSTEAASVLAAGAALLASAGTAVSAAAPLTGTRSTRTAQRAAKAERAMAISPTPARRILTLSY